MKQAMLMDGNVLAYSIAYAHAHAMHDEVALLFLPPHPHFLLKQRKELTRRVHWF